MDIEIRADGTLHIEGYVNAVERDSKMVICPECGKCVEQIRAGAFGEALRAPELPMNADLILITMIKAGLHQALTQAQKRA